MPAWNQMCMGPCRPSFRPFTLVLVLLTQWAATSRATDPRAVDGGLHDLQVFLPNNDPIGQPNAELRRLCDDISRQGIAIPPAIHVHRKYYDGDKEYQGPIIAGGPTVVVANHPRTNQRMYIDVVLPSGAPSIAYDARSITYVFKDRRVRIEFGALHADKFRVTNLPGRGLARTTHERGRAATERRELARQQNPLRQSITSARNGIAGASRGAAIATGNTLNRGFQATGRVVSALPGVRTLQSTAAQADAQRAEVARQAGLDSLNRRELPFFPTVR